MYGNLKEALKKKGISSKQYALILGVAEKTAYNKVYGDTEFTLAEVKKTCALLNEYSMDYLFMETEETEQKEGD